MTLSKEKRGRMTAFILEQARPLERALYRFHFENTPNDEALSELAAYQNADGGFGNALEPDLRTPQSSVMSTNVGLMHLRKLRVSASHTIAQNAIAFLLREYDPERKTWRPTGPFVNDAPHAPWWHYNEDAEPHFGQGLANPRAAIVGYLFDHATLVPAALRETLLAEVVAYLDTLPDPIEMHDLLCYVSLIETESLPADVKGRLLERLLRAAPRVVIQDPAQWGGYGLKPLWLAPTPASPFAETFAEAIAANLDYDIAQLADDGAPRPNWAYEEADWTATATREWRGIITLDLLLALKAYGRME